MKRIIILLLTFIAYASPLWAAETDAFGRNENPLSTGWATAGGLSALESVSTGGGLVQGTTASTDNGSVRSGTYPDDQYSEVTFTADTDSSGGPLVRGSSSGTGQGYFMTIYPGSIAILLKVTAGPTFTEMGRTAAGSATVSDGDVYKLSCTGGATTTCVLSKNGTPFTADTGTFVDSSSAWTSGKPGIIIYNTNMVFGTWGGTDANGGAETFGFRMRIRQ